MQVLLRTLRCFARDLEFLGDGNISITKGSNGIIMKRPGKSINCGYLLPWITNKEVKNGVITARHRVEFINSVNELFTEFYENDENLYLTAINNTIHAYRVSNGDKTITKLKEIKLIPINSWVLSKVLLIFR